MPQPTSPVRVLVAPHNFEIGGSQINALELAVAVAKLPGYEVILYAPDGELTERARQTGLELHLSTLREHAPSLPRIQELSKLVDHAAIDLVHTYEWAPTVDAVIALAWTRRLPLLSTILSMDYPCFLPPEVPTLFGTKEMWTQALCEGRKAYLLEPPVDTERFRPDAVDASTVSAVRKECDAAADEKLIVVVSRLNAVLKLDGLLALVKAAGEVARSFRIKLAIIGDGPARELVHQEAENVNKCAGRTVIHLLGARHDPLPYYAAADLVVGMGSSALRAMAVGKPLLVQGEKGFWKVADEDSAELFLSQGWYGIGDGGASVKNCVAQLKKLLEARKENLDLLGRFGRKLVVDEYSLTSAAEYLAWIYRQVLAAPKVSKGDGLVNIARLFREMTKYHTATRYPWVRTASRRLRGFPS
ncbi:glycosyltransferase [Aquamicrobium zhengzhouense]|uniref:Glycosyltransferase n=1 Tax=Aquamicrobium zhengzhouense TaxID=2781738 RepID=A0ABS0SBG6_9HYPH|nr:glycosyltransferase [Aquamicrobium zhengzhouense]MBI1620640.1 glycosyltransferase [Aquamicrobium zhengzhouense]